MQPPPPAQRASGIKAAMGAVENLKEEKMRLLTYAELGRYTRNDLAALYNQILHMLPGYPKGTLDYNNAVMNLRHIRIFLNRFTPYPMP